MLKQEAKHVYNALFLCTGNSARSILAESILRKDGKGRFNSYSAGSQLKGEVNPFALKVLAAFDYPADNMRSKGWEEFAKSGAPVMDFVFTVCDSAGIRHSRDPQHRRDVTWYRIPIDVRKPGWASRKCKVLTPLSPPLIT